MRIDSRDRPANVARDLHRRTSRADRHGRVATYLVLRHRRIEAGRISSRSEHIHLHVGHDPDHGQPLCVIVQHSKAPTYGITRQVDPGKRLVYHGDG